MPRLFPKTVQSPRIDMATGEMVFKVKSQDAKGSKPCRKRKRLRSRIPSRVQRITRIDILKIFAKRYFGFRNIGRGAGNVRILPRSRWQSPKSDPLWKALTNQSQGVLTDRRASAWIKDMRCYHFRSICLTGSLQDFMIFYTRERLILPHLKAESPF